jgi:hypothetical protein
MIYARAPYLSELYSIEGVMERATPSQLTKDGKEGVKFYFLKDSLYQDDHGASATYRHSDKENKPAIYVGQDGIGATLVKQGDHFEWQNHNFRRHRNGKDGRSTATDLLLRQSSRNGRRRNGHA